MSADLSKELWYYGRVSRTDAEKVLDSKGNIGGSFLVRDSLSVTGEYILSLSHSVSLWGLQKRTIFRREKGRLRVFKRL